MTDNTIENRITIIETKFDHFTSILEDIKKKLDEMMGEKVILQNLDTRLSVLEVKLSIVQWVGGLVGSATILYIMSQILTK